MSNAGTEEDPQRNTDRRSPPGLESERGGFSRGLAFLRTAGKKEENEKRNGCFIVFVCFQHFSICRDEHPSGRRYDEGRLVVGNAHQMVFHGLYCDTHYRWGLFDIETKLKEIASEIGNKLKTVIDRV